MSIEQMKNQTQQAIEAEVNRFRKEIDQINQSLDPRYESVAFKNDVISKKRKELEQRVREQEETFRKEAKQELEHAEAQAATSTIRPTESDRALAESTLSEFSSALALSYNDKQKAQAREELESKLSHMSREQLYAIKTQLPSVLRNAAGDEEALKQVRPIHRKLSEVKTEEQEQAETTKELADARVDGSFKRLKLTHKAFKPEKPEAGSEPINYVNPLYPKKHK
ncbi:hypothetical protein [Salimicrobium flavidum]|uniref:Uncharacterized protein n=1 Tax=Salimicrobium flavidum TaxID=570947 RepID=A0A1N7JXE8_9BACI|nr:hypothetical protein [Salimicrobium flavidum]SIS53961.1 hypothetical protein SAMN05421687_10821 [Salimicrobium flavidum]